MALSRRMNGSVVVRARQLPQAVCVGSSVRTYHTLHPVKRVPDHDNGQGVGLRRIFHIAGHVEESRQGRQPMLSPRDLPRIWKMAQVVLQMKLHGVCARVEQARHGRVATRDRDGLAIGGARVEAQHNGVLHVSVHGEHGLIEMVQAVIIKTDIICIVLGRIALRQMMNIIILRIVMVILWQTVRFSSLPFVACGISSGSSCCCCFDRSKEWNQWILLL